MLLTAHVERVSDSRVRDYCNIIILCHERIISPWLFATVYFWEMELSIFSDFDWLDWRGWVRGVWRVGWVVNEWRNWIGGNWFSNHTDQEKVKAGLDLFSEIGQNDPISNEFHANSLDPLVSATDSVVRCREKWWQCKFLDLALNEP